MITFNKLIEKINNNTYKKAILPLEDRKIDDGKVIRLAKALQNNKYIIELDISSNRITSIGIKALCETKLIKLKINNIPIDDEGAAYLANSKTILELEAQACDISAHGTNLLFTNNLFKSINLSFNYIKKEGFITLPANTTLRALILVQSGVDDDCAELIAQARGLKIVNLSTNPLTDRGAIFLSLSSTIEELNLNQANINDIGVSPFGINTSLKKLDLFNCRITPAGTKFLSKNRSLVDLDLSFNQLDDECAPHFVCMPNLKFLSLTHNKITTKGQEILRQSNSIEVLGLGYNLIAKNPQEKNEIQPEDKVIPCSAELKNINSLPADMPSMAKKDKISQSAISSENNNKDTDTHQSFQSKAINKKHHDIKIPGTRTAAGQKKRNASNKRQLNNSKYPKTQKKQKTESPQINTFPQQQVVPMTLFKLHVHARPKLTALKSNNGIKHTQKISKKYNSGL